MTDSIQCQQVPSRGNSIYVMLSKNIAGAIGFVFAIIGLLFSFVHILAWAVLAAGAILSIIGLFYNPKRFAIAGTIISLIGGVLILQYMAAYAGIGGMSL